MNVTDLKSLIIHHQIKDDKRLKIVKDLILIYNTWPVTIHTFNELELSAESLIKTKLSKTNIIDFIKHTDDTNSLKKPLIIIQDLLDETGFNSWNLYWDNLKANLLEDQKNTPLIIREEKGYPIIHITPDYFEIKPLDDKNFKRYDLKNIKKVSISIRTNGNPLFQIRGHLKRTLENLEPSDFIVHIDDNRKWEYDIPHSPSKYFRETVLMINEAIYNCCQHSL